MFEPEEEPARSSPADMRRRNRTAALQLVLSGAGRTTRAGIVRATGLTSATVSSLLAELIEEGLVEEGSLARSTGGKRATLLNVDDQRHVLVSVVISPRLVRGAVLNLLGETIDAVTARVEDTTSVEDVRRLVRRLVAGTSATPLAVGVQLPGITEGGLVRESVQLGWTDVDLGAALEADGAPPVHLINDADAEALAEFSSVDDADTAHMYVSLSGGVGAAFLIDGELQRGAAGRVGEIGHVPVLFGPEAPRCPCGARGCLEELVSVTALLGLEHGAELGSVDIPALARRTESRERIATGARALARTLLLAGAAFDVPSVVLGGYAPALGPDFLGHVRSEAARYPVSGAMPLGIRYASSAGRVPFRGAAQYALRRSLGVTWTR